MVFQPLAMVLVTELRAAGGTLGASQLYLQLVEQRLAACVNILPACTSVYRWNDAVESATEVPVLIKTTLARYPALQAALTEISAPCTTKCEAAPAADP